MYLFISTQIINDSHLIMSHIDQVTEHWLDVNARNPWSEVGRLLYIPGQPTFLKKSLSEDTCNQWKKISLTSFLSISVITSKLELYWVMGRSGNY